MIVLHASIPVDAARREEALEHVEALVEQSNHEDGMIEYRAAVDVQDENTIRVFEQYEDEAALDAHFRSDHFQTFTEHVPELAAGEPKIVKFTIDEATELDL